MSSRSPLHFTLCGNPGPWDQHNPYKVTSAVDIQRLLKEINSHPLDSDGIPERIGVTSSVARGHTQALLKAGLVGEDEGALRPTFAIFTNPDIERLLEWTSGVSEDLVSQIESSIPEVREFIRGIGMGTYPEMEYLVIVAFGLDFGGLEVLEEHGLIVVSKPMPGNRAYIFTGVERGLYDPQKAWMWGHTDTVSGVFYCTHGTVPEEGSRRALPDLFWTSNDTQRGKMGRIGKDIAGVLRLGEKSEESQWAGIPEALALREALDLLKEIGYVSIDQERLKFLIPVLRNDGEIRALGRRMMKRVVISVIEPSIDSAKEIYERTTPGRNGIAFHEGFNFIYHLLFERSVDLILNEGIIESPPRRPDGATYVCCAILDR